MRRTLQMGARRLGVYATYVAALAGCDIVLGVGNLRERGVEDDGGMDATTGDGSEASSGTEPGADGSRYDGAGDAAGSQDGALTPEAHDVTAANADGPTVGDVVPQDASDVGTADEGAGPADGGVNLLVNPGFEQGYLGWLFSPASAMSKYAYTQYAPTGGTTVDGQFELATWSGTDAFTVRVYQVLSNVPPGTYSFRGWFNRGPESAAYIYASCGGATQQANIPPAMMPTSWIQVSITGIAATGGSCEVGFYVDAIANDWLNADAFTFELTSATPADAGGE
jgi:hypothetical protein